MHTKSRRPSLAARVSLPSHEKRMWGFLATSRHKTTSAGDRAGEPSLFVFAAQLPRRVCRSLEKRTLLLHDERAHPTVGCRTTRNTTQQGAPPHTVAGARTAASRRRTTRHDAGLTRHCWACPDGHCVTSTSNVGTKRSRTVDALAVARTSPETHALQALDPEQFAVVGCVANLFAQRTLHGSLCSQNRRLQQHPRSSHSSHRPLQHVLSHDMPGMTPAHAGHFAAPKSPAQVG